MSKTAKKKSQGPGLDWIVLSSGPAFQKRFGVHEALRQVSKKNDLAAALRHSSASSLWIVQNKSWTDHLLKAASDFCLQHPSLTTLGDLILCEAPRNEVLPSLHAIFRRVIGEVPSFKMLPREQLAEALASENRGDLFIGGAVDEESGILTLARGDCRMLTVPLSFFQPTIDSKPEFEAFELDDHGYAVRFGSYEASAHSVLYGFDRDYRRRVNKQRTAEETGFGASLKRLRLLRGLNQDQMDGVASKTIARIERGETGKPHGETLAKIAKALGVSPDEIERY
jgi:DNA-binding XRE family transcriptional regulator